MRTRKTKQKGGFTEGLSKGGAKKGAPKKADLNTQVGRYFLAKVAGKNKKESAELAGYATGVKHTARIEQSQAYKAIEQKYYKDVLLGKMNIEQIADEHIKNILQDDDRGAKNKAIEMALKKVEPDANPESDDDKVLIVLKG